MATQIVQTCNSIRTYGAAWSATGHAPTPPFPVGLSVTSFVPALAARWSDLEMGRTWIGWRGWVWVLGVGGRPCSAAEIV